MMNENRMSNRRSGKRYSGASVAREKTLNRPFRWLWRLMTLSVISIVLVFGGNKLLELYRHVNEQTMEVVRIEGNINQETELQIRRVMARYMNQSFVQIDLTEVRNLLVAEAWIDSVELRREWPQALVVKVVEQVAVARWGETDLLNQRGEIFSPGDLGSNIALPVLTGPAGMEKEVMSQFQKFTQLLYPLGLKVAALNLNQRQAWQLILDNEVVVHVGKNDLMEKMRRFVTLVDSRFINQMALIESIDLRYANGVSVSRRPIESEEVVSL